MKASELRACIRKESGKGPARRLKREGLIPAVFYGPRTETMLLSINSSALLKLIREKEENVFIKLVIDDQDRKMEKFSVLKELQTNPITGRFYHADFCEISMDDKLVFDIPLHFIGKPVGIEEGGNFQHLKRELKVSCLPAVLPAFIEVDVSGLRIGDAIKVRDIKPVDGVTILDPEDAVIAMVTAPRVVAETEKEDESKSSAEEKE
ncbi:MAG: 50S ribosomal protein L25/general stress protein Ctc [Syntrophales bacterium]|nr:50S ribosomal protein L25/general stress protein Ctc [Syntrophales bacterium]